MILLPSCFTLNVRSNGEEGETQEVVTESKSLLKEMFLYVLVLVIVVLLVSADAVMDNEER